MADAQPDFGILHHRKTRDKIAVAADEFCGAVHHDVKAEFKRSLQQGRHERVVGDGKQAAFMGDFSHCGKIGDFKRGV